jgi:hypothetical protein
VGLVSVVLLVAMGVGAWLLKRALFAAGRSDDRPVKIVSMGAPARAAAPPARKAWSEDLTFGDPTARRLRAALQGGEWQPVHQHLEGCRGWPARELLVEALGAHEVLQGREALLDQWCAARPDSALPRLVRGRWRIAAAWAARGSGGASTVSQQGWQRFFRLLQQADEDLAAAAALDPQDPTPCALRLTTSRGLQLGQEETARRFEATVARDPHHRLAHAMRLASLCRKWSGSHEQMFAFARQAAQAAPEGSLLGGLIAQAHAERWLWARSFAEKEADDPQWFGKAGSYFQDPAVREELQRAWDRSLGSPSFREVGAAAHARNWFAFCLHLAGDRERTRAALEPLGKHATEVPWTWLGQAPPQAVNQARAGCGLPPLAA